MRVAADVAGVGVVKDHIGQCLCGSIQFSLKGPLNDILSCHCHQCQRQSSYFVVAASECQAASVAISDRHNKLTWYQSASTEDECFYRGFCGECGSVLFWQKEPSEHISIMMGAFTTSITHSISANIYTDYRGSYYALPTAPNFHTEIPADVDLSASVVNSEALNSPLQDPQSGSCLCGDIGITVPSPNNNARACHCIECRRWTGHAFASISYPIESVTISDRDSRLQIYNSSSNIERAFCQQCASKIYWRNTIENSEIDVASGMVNALEGLTLSEHIWRQEQGCYYSL